MCKLFDLVFPFHRIRFGFIHFVIHQIQWTSTPCVFGTLTSTMLNIPLDKTYRVTCIVGSITAFDYVNIMCFHDPIPYLLMRSSLRARSKSTNQSTSSLNCMGSCGSSSRISLIISFRVFNGICFCLCVYLWKI